MVEIVEISGNIAKYLCEKITENLPAYFGLPEANEKYFKGVLKNKNFAAKINNEFVGLISIETPYPNNINIYWLAVLREHQSNSIGYKLVRTAHDYAIQNNFKTMTVETLAPKNSDENYLRTYNFYISNSFLPLFNLKPDGYKWEMVYMLKRLDEKSVQSKENVCASYERIAQWYDSRKDYLYEQAWLDRFLSQLKPASDILDIGCGMGEPIDKYFLDRNFNVTGVDGCKKFIEMASQRVPQSKFILNDMRELNLKQKFDAIIAWNSLFHLTADDQKNMFKTFVKHLNDGGILMFTTGSEAGEVWSDNGGENLYHASLSPDEYKQLIKEHGFELIDYKINDKECNDHTVWLARYKNS